ncbi:c-type cytochrome [Pararoseomonas baculiformis]|nr:c-type cytochrome [Pararoseomonas baculiformis]
MRATAFATVIALAGCDEAVPDHLRIPGGNARLGARIVAERDCGVCHVIPGLRGARGRVGPSLAGFGARGYVAGVLPNNPDNLLWWLQDPPAVAPGTAMPDLGLRQEEARHVAAFLYGLR